MISAARAMAVGCVHVSSVFSRIREISRLHGGRLETAVQQASVVAPCCRFLLYWYHVVPSTFLSGPLQLNLFPAAFTPVQRLSGALLFFGARLFLSYSHIQTYERSMGGFKSAIDSLMGSNRYATRSKLPGTGFVYILTAFKGMYERGGRVVLTHSCQNQSG